ncbi:hypothetical protein L1987_70829 [Smallanthus sonchifolius]|uniref:Uncharacterized protein n=1 Tax=Smallanthus sonchifolius TaxID=185202 RepID=A0ACB9ASC2_9ASTR|nr:hypothetical protein L1987_70829 [Smallanthus sonchifolius]
MHSVFFKHNQESGPSYLKSKAETTDVEEIKDVDESTKYDGEMVVRKLPSERQCMFFSATMPGWVKKLSRKYPNNPSTMIWLGYFNLKRPDVGIAPCTNARFYDYTCWNCTTPQGKNTSWRYAQVKEGCTQDCSTVEGCTMSDAT